MRNLDEYDIIITDIDDTLIYGFWTDLMHYTWNWFRSPILSKILMFLQNKFSLYKVNQKLVYMLKKTKTPLVVMTVRAKNDNTIEMLSKILERDFKIYELETDYGFIVKPQAICDLLEDYPRAIFFEDNKQIRDEARQLEIDVIDPTLMREELCQ